jgi:integrase
MPKYRTGYLFKRNGSFYVQWRVNGKLFSKALRDDQGRAISTRREAEDAQTKFMATFAVADETTALESIAAKLEGRKAELAKLDEQQNPPLAIGNAWAAYMAATNRPDSGDRTLRGYESMFGAFARWAQEKHAAILTLLEVTPSIAEEYAGSLNHGGLSAGTFNKHLNLLKMVFRVLKAKGRLMVNPWDDIQRKRIVPNSRRELTIEELRSVCQSATGELRVLLSLGVYSGLRLGDCATLRWAEVDMARHMIRRIPNKTARRNSKPVIVPIHPVLMEMLAMTAPEQRSEYVLPEMADLYKKGPYIITNMVKRHLISCKIKPHKPGTGGKGNKRAVVEVGFHSLRHTFVSLCRESNAPLAVVESLVGHSSPAMTRHYTHVGELAAGRAVACLPNVMGEVTKAEPQKRDAEALLREVKAIAENITGTNWLEKKTALLALVNVGAEDGQTGDGELH